MCEGYYSYEPDSWRVPSVMSGTVSSGVPLDLEVDDSRDRELSCSSSSGKLPLLLYSFWSNIEHSRQFLVISSEFYLYFCLKSPKILLKYDYISEIQTDQSIVYAYLVLYKYRIR